MPTFYDLRKVFVNSPSVISYPTGDPREYLVTHYEVADHKEWIWAQDLYEGYRDWCWEHNCTPISSVTFHNLAMLSGACRGIKKGKRYYSHIAPLTPASPPAP